MFVFTRCGRQRALPLRGVNKIKKSAAKNDILNKLRAFLDAEEPQTIEFLISAWGKQQSAITYKELREAVLSGDISPAQLAQWKIDYSKLVSEKLAPQWEKAMTAAAEKLKQKYPLFI